MQPGWLCRSGITTNRDHCSRICEDVTFLKSAARSPPFQYTLCDSILLLQIYYYRWKKSNRLTSSDERSPLLATVNAEDVGLQQEQVMPAKMLAIRYASASLFVCAAGVAAWWISSITASDEEIPQHPRKALRWEIQAIGWTSAMLYRTNIFTARVYPLLIS